MSARAAKRARPVSSSSAIGESEIKPDKSVGPMLQYQHGIPHLPIPTISSTAHKYLETVRPHVTEAQYNKTQAAVQEFLHSNHVKTLQQRLQDRAALLGMKNWLSDWWNEVA